MSRRKAKIAVFGVIIVSAFLLVAFLQQNYVLPILMYHSVNPQVPAVGLPWRGLVVSDKTFERQMRFLKTHHYNVLPLESAASLIRLKKKIPPKTVAITLDDGYKDNFTYAFPILKKYNLPATMFIIVNEVGRPQSDRLSWDEIRIMQASGIITFGSHTIGPEPLVNIKSEEEIRRQIFDSKKILEERLGAKVNAFSYPEGRFTGYIRQLAIDAGYKLAVATNPGKDYPSDDVFALKRLRISENAKNMFVFAVESSGFYTFMKEHKRKKHEKK